MTKIKEYPISAKLDKEAFDKLKKDAKAHERSISAQIRIAIKAWKP